MYVLQFNNLQEHLKRAVVTCLRKERQFKYCYKWVLDKKLVVIPYSMTLYRSSIVIPKLKVELSFPPRPPDQQRFLYVRVDGRYAYLSRR